MESEIKANISKIEDYISRLEKLKREEELIANDLDWYFDVNNYDAISNALEMSDSLDDFSLDFDKNIEYLKTINEKIIELKKTIAENCMFSFNDELIDIEVYNFLNDQENRFDVNVNLEELNLLIRKLNEKLEKHKENKNLNIAVDNLNECYKHINNFRDELKEKSLNL